MKRLLRVLLALAVLAAYPAWLGWRIWDQSHKDEFRRADAIVVLGAAQYNGEPSPIFQARLDHAAFLYREDFSDLVIVTGGKASGDRFTEAEAGANYLVKETVPEVNIMRVGVGRTTLQSLQEVRAVTMDREIDTVLLVSDPLHSERIKAMARDLGFERAYASWTSYRNLQRSRITKAKELMREIVSLAAYQILDR